MLQFEFFFQESYSICSKLYIQDSASRNNVAVAHMSVYIVLIPICMTFILFFHKKLVAKLQIVSLRKSL